MELSDPHFIHSAIIWISPQNVPILVPINPIACSLLGLFLEESLHCFSGVSAYGVPWRTPMGSVTLCLSAGSPAGKIVSRRSSRALVLRLWMCGAVGRIAILEEVSSDPALFCVVTVPTIASSVYAVPVLLWQCTFAPSTPRSLVHRDSTPQPADHFIPVVYICILPSFYKRKALTQISRTTAFLATLTTTMRGFKAELSVACSRVWSRTRLLFLF